MMVIKAGTHMSFWQRSCLVLVTSADRFQNVLGRNTLLQYALANQLVGIRLENAGTPPFLQGMKDEFNFIFKRY